ncbi:gfo/Idh/MocA family oxidoreductase [Acetobacterium fimetarium]|uniref:Gfo/Idh/MocA family oxidoreductase n=1 Tax=Acetobacterium fimetarium TaxID=52691 RepID=A0ABR6WYJ9_9FIRM|nr:Gfo/Idh/MocA family oxidoreductase [Acetobacterium fimetarium]MBC3805672.1 gfo/Idh/MocA family oxidoreductase [Acetobacterium fimetarium]
MKVIVIGLGSMGKRRIRLISKFDDKIQIIGVDTNEERRKKCSIEYKIETFDNLNDVADITGFDSAFVCTSPLTHHIIITECLNLGLNIFSELNLVDDGYEKNIRLAEQNELVLFMSSTFLYREEIQKIKALIEQANCKLNYSYHVGQYLPDWHPWENYQDFFVSDKLSNGCREIFAIEIPWLIDVFGDIDKVDVVKSKMSDLNIDYNDNYLILVQHSSGHKGALEVDVVSRKAVRNLEVFGEKLYIHWDGSPTGLYEYNYEEKVDVNLQLYKEIDQLENYSSFVVENDYFNEITSFFEAVLKGKAPLYSFEKDKEILKIIDRIES